NVRIQDQSGAPILVSADKWEYVWVRVLDLRRNVICESGLSKDTIQTKVQLVESMIPILLPEGTWLLEVSTQSHRGPWYHSTNPVTVTSIGRPIEVTIRITDEKKRQSKYSKRALT